MYSNVYYNKVYLQYNFASPISDEIQTSVGL